MRNELQKVKNRLIAHPGATFYCPITGLRIRSQPEWIDTPFSDTFRGTFLIIDDTVIYSIPEGRADHLGVQNSLKLKEKIVRESLNTKGSYIQIQDYSLLTHSSSEARSLFTRNANEDRRLQAMIFCNLSSTLSIAVKIGNRFLSGDRDINITKNYRHAIRLATSLIKPRNAPLSLPGIKFDDCFQNKGACLEPIEVIINDDWVITTPEFSSQTIVIDQNILYTANQGIFNLFCIESLNRIRHQCREAIPNGQNLDYLIANTSKLKEISRHTRFSYVKSIRDWHNHSPLKYYIAFGGPVVMDSMFRLGNFFMPFSVKATRDGKHAFQVMRDDRDGVFSRQLNDQQKKRVFQLAQKDIDQLVSAMAKINWEQEGISDEYLNMDHHPFYPIYQSISLVKEELDELFNERKRLESLLFQSKKMEVMGTLAGGIAHDFNNILSAIFSLSQQAINSIHSPEIATSFITQINDAGVRAAHLVNQILAFTRKSEFKKQSLDVGQVVSDAVDMLRSTLPKTVEISEEIKTNKLVLGDPGKIHQVVMNLCTNAFQSLPEGKGTLTIVLSEMEIGNILASEFQLIPGSYLLLEVTDNGHGMDTDTLDKIFDPYFTTKEAGKGTGLGLSIVYNIIREHNGHIKVCSDPNQGSSLYVYLPEALDLSE